MMLTGLVYGAALALTLVAPAAEAAPPAQFARQQFMDRCLPQMDHHAQRFPDHICGCLHDRVLAIVRDADLRAAVMRNIEETGRPGVDRERVPDDKRNQIESTLSEIAAPAIGCLYGDASR